MYHVSIIMPVYNVSEHLPRAIESALNQKEVSLELILVNDGSTDQSGEICDAYAKEEPLLIKVIHQENQGSGPARQAGLKEASGEYIYFADPDDYFDHTLLKDNIKHAKKRDAEVVMFGFKQEDSNGDNQQINLPNLPQLESREDFRMHFRNVYHFYPYALWNKLYKKDFLMKNGITFGNQKQGQDALFNIEVYKHLSSVAVNRHAYYHYVTHEGSAINRYRQDRMDMELNIARSFQKMIKSWGETDTFTDLIAEEYFNVLYQETVNLVHPACPLSTKEKAERLTYLWETQAKVWVLEHKKEENNPFRKALLNAYKGNDFRRALFLMSNRIKVAKQYSKTFNSFKNFFKN